MKILREPKTTSNLSHHPLEIEYLIFLSKEKRLIPDRIDSVFLIFQPVRGWFQLLQLKSVYLNLEEIISSKICKLFPPFKCQQNRNRGIDVISGTDLMKTVIQDFNKWSHQFFK